MKLGLLLQAYRAVHGIQAKDLAKEIGIDAPNLSRIERGGRESITGATLVKIMVWLCS